MSVCPAFIDIRRGCALAAVLAVALTPWNLVNSAQGFINFLGAYGSWLSPISAIGLVDYYILRRGKLDIRQLYVHPNGIYSYGKWGINPRAYIAFTVAFVPNLPGFINAINPAVNLDVPIYRFNWYFGITVAALTYGVLCKYIWPLPQGSILDEAVYPDEAYIWPEHEHDHTSSGSVEKGRVQDHSPDSGSFDHLDIDIIHAKSDTKDEDIKE
ncbi:hypothetical protein L1887_48241 [Cichorium endivia]|nr:hypothetical protein L1887_48241 [Cichorium endivia]